MQIVRLIIDGGFLDGLNLELKNGLNVLIGERGTGKTSVIELIRFCFGTPAHTTKANEEAEKHASGVLKDGRVTVEVSVGDGIHEISRSFDDPPPKLPEAVQSPIIFSQREIESIGLTAAGRLRLVDDFITNNRASESEETSLISEIRSATTEIRGLLAQMSDAHEELKIAPQVKKELAQSRKEENAIAAKSIEAERLQKKMEPLREKQSSLQTEIDGTEEIIGETEEWLSKIVTVVEDAPSLWLWDSDEVQNPALQNFDKSITKVTTSLMTAKSQGDGIVIKISAELDKLKLNKRPVDTELLVLRKQIEKLTAGAGQVSRRVTELAKKQQQLNSLKKRNNDRLEQVAFLKKNRRSKLDMLDALREEQTSARREIADHLSERLSPQVKVQVEGSSQLREYESSIRGALRGSGLKYNELAGEIARAIAPRELVELSEDGEFEQIAELAGISVSRAARVAERIRETGGGKILSRRLDDDAKLTLLDGTKHKAIDALSTGQKCTVVLPILLQHTERVLIVDQPEDHLDNSFVVETIIASLKSRTKSSQFLFATHNPNIPVLGDADNVVHLGSDGSQGYIRQSGALDDAGIVGAISRIMEGGKEAFERRAKFYREHNN